MKKMMRASMALWGMGEPQVGPAVVMLILSTGTVVGVVVAAVVDVVVGAVVDDPWVGPAAAGLAVVVVVGLAVVVVVGGGAGACASVSLSMAACTLLLTCVCADGLSLFRSDCTLRVCLLPVPSSSTVGSMTPVPFMASVAWVCVMPGAAMVHSVPPLNSMPRFRPPRKMMVMIPRTMMADERLNQILRRPTKSNRVSPR